MSARSHRKRRQRPLESTDIELMPMLNVFMAIIPLLLLGAAFVPVSVISASLPAAATDAAAEAPTEAPLDLVIRIRPDAYHLYVNGTPIRTVSRPERTTDSAAQAAEDAARGQLVEALREIAAAHTGEREVRIVSQGSTRYREIIDVMDASRAAGLPEAALSDDGEEDPR